MNGSRVHVRALLFLALVCACCGRLAAADPVEARLKEYLDQAVKTDGFSGSVLVIKDDRTLHAAGYGLANIELDVPNTPQTRFRIGSITKQFTAAAILLLAEQGKLAIDDPLKKYLSEVPASWDAIRIEHLLNHTSGLFNVTALPDSRRAQLLPATPLETLLRVQDRPLDFAPGADFRYSNTGYVALGLVVERVAQMPYERFLQQTIFEPLEMKSTGYDHQAPIVPRRAAGYSRMRGELLNAQYVDMSVPFAAGALGSTVEDLARWDRALRGDRLLTRKSREAMFTPGKGNYGYGWMIVTRSGRQEISHGGSINGFNSFFIRIPEEKACVVVLSNIMTNPPGRLSRMAHELIDISLSDAKDAAEPPSADATRR